MTHDYRAFSRLGDLQNARIDLAKLKELRPTSDEFRISQASYSLLAGEFEKSREIGEALTRSETPSARRGGHFILFHYYPCGCKGRSSSGSRKVTKVLDIRTRVLLFSNYAPSSLWNKKKASKAAADHRRIFAAQSQKATPRHFFSAGNANFINMGRPLAALDDFTQALKLDPDLGGRLHWWAFGASIPHGGIFSRTARRKPRSTSSEIRMAVEIQIVRQARCLIGARSIRTRA